MIGLQQLLFILITVVMLAIGQVLFKFAAMRIDIASKGLIASLIFNPALIVALMVYALATISWLFVLKNMPLRLAYPFAALGFFIVPLMSYFFLNEPLRWSSFGGAAIIMLGVYVSTL